MVYPSVFLSGKERTMKMIKNIIFDVGKVLVEFDWESAFHKLGIEGEAFEVVADATVRSTDWNEYDRSSMSDEEQLRYFIAKAPAYEKEIRLFWENVGLPIWQYDYSMGLVKELRSQGYHTYILSNYARHTYECTREALSFEREMDGVVFSYEVGSIKPEPEIYRILLERYDLVPEECVFLDDKPENLKAAAQFGIHTIQFTTLDAIKDELEKFGIVIS